jgi:pimeloyl-ACP methyl ester carboxylesterase
MTTAHRRRTSPLDPGWVIVDGLPMYHRSSITAGDAASAIVHVHGFGISGTYLEPTAELLVDDFRNFVPDLPGHGRSMRPEHRPDIPSLALAVVGYCDALGLDRVTLVGNSLGCPVISEVVATNHERVERVVFVSPAGGPNNQPLARALGQMAVDGIREPLSMVPIAVRDYLRFGLLSGLSLFRALLRFPTLDRLHHLDVPTLVVVGVRDPLVNTDRVGVLSGLPHVRAVTIPGAHALNFSRPEAVSALIRAHMTDGPLHLEHGPLAGVVELEVPDAPVADDIERGRIGRVWRRLTVKG